MQFFWVLLCTSWVHLFLPSLWSLCSIIGQPYIGPFLQPRQTRWIPLNLTLWKKSDLVRLWAPFTEPSSALLGTSCLCSGRGRYCWRGTNLDPGEPSTSFEEDDGDEVSLECVSLSVEVFICLFWEVKLQVLSYHCSLIMSFFRNQKCLTFWSIKVVLFGRRVSTEMLLSSLLLLEQLSDPGETQSFGKITCTWDFLKDPVYNLGIGDQEVFVEHCEENRSFPKLEGKSK